MPNANTQKYQVKPYNSSLKDAWNTLVAQSKNATFLFNRNFMDYHQDRFQDASVMIFKNEKLVAVFPANSNGNIIFSHQGLTYGGLVFRSKLKFHSVLKIFKSLLQYYYSEGFKTLQLKQLPSIYSPIPNDALNYLMFILEAKLLKRDALSVVNQAANLPFSKDRKDGVKRGIKQGLIIKQETNFEAFWNTILIPNLKEKHNAKPVHSLKEIEKLHRLFPDNIKQFNVYHNNKLVAGTTIFETDMVAHSQYISGNADKNKLGSLDFLHNYLLKETFKDKPYFDFGISNKNQGKQVNAGLQYWKEGFGARTITQDFYTLPIKNHDKLTQVML